MLAAQILACGGDLAPASRGLVFVRIVNGSNEIYRARIDDGALLAVTDTSEREERWPYWSDAADRVLFQASQRVPQEGGGAPGWTRGQSDLFLWNPNDGVETPLQATPGRDEQWHAWSPDGRTVAYAFNDVVTPAGIALLELSTGRITPLAATGLTDDFYRPTFAPDGSRLVAQRHIGDRHTSALWILGPGRVPVPFTKDPAWFDMKPRFTRDVARVVFSRRPAAGGLHDIVSASVRGGELRVIASTPGSDDHAAEPSPVTDEMVFVSDRAGSFDIFVANLDGGAVRPLTRSPRESEFAPHWSPDGRRVVTTVVPGRRRRVESSDRARLEQVRIRVLDRDGRVLLDTPGLMPDWMPPWK